LFVADGELLVPTGLVRGGWSDDAQHGGPPCALLARAIEQADTLVPMHVARVTFDLIRPVPIEPLRTSVAVVRPGKRIQLIAASLWADDVEVAKATALQIRCSEVDLPEPPDMGHEAPGRPDEAHLLEWGNWLGALSDLPRFHLHAVEIRTFDESFRRPGPGLSWLRLRYPVVAGEETSALVRTAAVADIGNGNSTAIDPEHFLYVNPDVTLYLHRYPHDEWLGMRSVAHQHRTGIGVADTELFDQDGPLGRIVQAQLVEAHHRPTS
jgi:hypothetical protein